MQQVTELNLNFYQTDLKPFLLKKSSMPICLKNKEDIDF